MGKDLLDDYFPEFMNALYEQLEADQKRWGDNWIKQGRPGQEKRFFNYVTDVCADYGALGIPMPWLKIAGEALIGWVRETKKDWKK